jgi:hypothetical protein
MKIDLGGGAYLEPDEDPRESRFHMGIVCTERIPNTRVGHYAALTCGHRVLLFGDPALAGGRVLCTQCRDAAGAQP